MTLEIPVVAAAPKASAPARAVPEEIEARVTAVGRREYRLFLAGIGLATVPIIDDNFLHPAPGTSAADHLASGLVPLGVLAGIAVLYPRLRAGLRAAVSMTLGAIVFAVGFPGAYYIRDGSAAFDHYVALLAFVAGALLLALGALRLALGQLERLVRAAHALVDRGAAIAE